MNDEELSEHLRKAHRVVRAVCRVCERESLDLAMDVFRTGVTEVTRRINALPLPPEYGTFQCPDPSPFGDIGHWSGSWSTGVMAFDTFDGIGPHSHYWMLPNGKREAVGYSSAVDALIGMWAALREAHPAKEGGK